MNEVGHTRAPVQEVEVTSVTSKISNCILKTEATKTAPEMLDLAHPPALVTKAIEDSAIFREQLELARESHQNKGSTSSYDFVDRCSTDQSNLKSFEIIVNHEDEKHLVIEQHTSKAISEAEYKLATLDNNAAVASNTRKAELDKEVAQLMSEHARKEIEYTNKVAEDRISLQELKQDLLNQQQQDRQNRDQCITKSRCMVELGKRAINLVSKTAKTGVIDTKEEKAIKEGSAAYKSSDFSRMKKEILNIDLLPESIDE